MKMKCILLCRTLQIGDPAPLPFVGQPERSRRVHWSVWFAFVCLDLSIGLASPYGHARASRQEDAHHWNWNEGNRLGNYQGALGRPYGRAHDEPEDAKVSDFS